MPRQPKRAAKKAPYVMVDQRTWALVRADYLGGMTAAAVAEKYGVGRHNVTARISREGWTKRALAEARARPGPGGPPLPDTPGPGGPGAPDAGAAGGRPAGKRPAPNLMETVLARARAALEAGRGAEATALLKAFREYVLVSQAVEDSRKPHAKAIDLWDRLQPDRAGELTEPVMLRTLHDWWSGLDFVEAAYRADPEDKDGIMPHLWAAKEREDAAKKTRR
jgi:hypothetical protein